MAARTPAMPQRVAVMVDAVSRPTALAWCTVSRVNDVGGQQGFGVIEPDPDEGPGFHADWEARVFAMVRVLLGRGAYNLDEFRDAVERMPPQDYLVSSYYERWLTGIETLLVEKGLLDRE
jgi:nitrile hydratase